MFDHGTDVVFSKFSSEIAPVIPFIGRYNLHLVQVPGQYLPPDLCVMWPTGRAVNIQDSSGLTIGEHRSFQRQKAVLGALVVSSAGGNAIKTRRIDCDGLTQVELLEGFCKQPTTDRRRQPIERLADGGWIGEMLERELQQLPKLTEGRQFIDN